MSNQEVKLKPSFEDLRSANIERDKEWDKDEVIDLNFRGNELAGEVGEACNKIKKLVRERLGLPGTRATQDELMKEIGDVVICADLIAMDEGFSLQDAVQSAFNKTSKKYGLSVFLSASRPSVEEDEHPEKRCHECGALNPSWHAPNELWNRVMGGPNGIICPVCFQAKADAMGIVVHATVDLIRRPSEDLANIIELISQLDDFCVGQFKKLLSYYVDSAHRLKTYSIEDQEEFILSLSYNIKKDLENYLIQISRLNQKGKT